MNYKTMETCKCCYVSEGYIPVKKDGLCRFCYTAHIKAGKTLDEIIRSELSRKLYMLEVEENRSESRPEHLWSFMVQIGNIRNHIDDV